MSALPHITFTLEEYFALERASERRFEFRDGEVVCMSGGTIEHAAIADNVRSALRSRLADKGCRAFSSDLAVYVPAGRPYRYPDASVVCDEPLIRKIDGRDALENPVLLVEVLSETSADFDRGTKFEEYKSIPSFTEYLLVEQTKAWVACRTRLEDGSWIERVVQGRDAVVVLNVLGVEIALEEIYEGVALPSGDTSS